MQKKKNKKIYNNLTSCIRDTDNENKNKYAIHAYTHGPVTGSGPSAVRLPIG